MAYQNVIQGLINYISKFCQKKPKNAIILILKLGIYQIKYLDLVPDYTAVSNTVELNKEVCKNKAGFVNEILNKFDTTEFEFPKDEIKAIYIKYLVPEFIVK